MALASAALLLASLAPLHAQVPSAAGTPVPVRERVWNELKNSSVPRAFVDQLFDDARLAIDPAVIPRVSTPSEGLPYERYRLIFITERRIGGGAAFVKAHHTLLDQVSQRYGALDPLLLVSLVGVETVYGAAAGGHVVFNALYTLADRVPPRMRFAERELAELIKFCQADGRDAYSVKGSYAGAFGYGQFIPSSWNKYAVDFDGDGFKSHDRWPDVLATIANYLTLNGYRRDAAGTRRAVYAYNHSDNYVRVVLELRDEIAKRLKPVKIAKKRK